MGGVQEHDFLKRIRARYFDEYKQYLGLDETALVGLLHDPIALNRFGLKEDFIKPVISMLRDGPWMNSSKASLRDSCYVKSWVDSI